MTAPRTTIPLRDAVLAALTTVTNKTHAIPTANLFHKARPSKGAQRAATVKGQPTAWVTVKDHLADQDALLLEMSTVRREACTVEILCTYYAGSELFSDEHDLALIRIEEDRQHVLRALLYPEALRLDPDGNDTGLDGGSLRFDLYRSIGPAPSPVSTPTARLLEVTHVFVTKVELSSPSA